MIAKIPTLAAMAYKYTIGQPFVYPKNSLSFAENFLHMCFAVPCEEYKINPVLANALDKIFILHADHEQNASTSTVRIAGSSGANPFCLHRRRHRLPVGSGAMVAPTRPRWPCWPTLGRSTKFRNSSRR